MSDFKPNKLGFDVDRCNDMLIQMADKLMDEQADVMVNLFKRQIDYNGNGDLEYMKDDAKLVVREILHEVARDHITIHAGFDEAMAKSMGIDFYVRTMVVIHGNQGGGPLHEKPGEETWKKYVMNRGMPNPDHRKADNMLPDGFNQYDVSEHIVENVMKDIEKHFRVMLMQLQAMCDSAFWSQFITGGR